MTGAESWSPGFQPAQGSRWGDTPPVDGTDPAIGHGAMVPASMAHGSALELELGVREVWLLGEEEMIDLKDLAGLDNRSPSES